MSTELPTDAIRYCIEGCRDYKHNTNNEPDTAYAELQALLDDRDFWRQTATDLEQSIQNCISENDMLGYMLHASIRNFNDAVDARTPEKCDECVGYGQVDLQTGQQCCPCNGTGIKAKQEDK